ncbi:hypothetical protein EDB89DRAFT_2041662, partial [Lactarius sanguifluus]
GPCRCVIVSLLDSPCGRGLSRFNLDIPANNCVILQSDNDLELLPAGQHCISHLNIMLRRLYTVGEN